MSRLSRSDIDEWAERFALLSDSTRLHLIQSMHEQPGATVAQLASAVGITVNAASQSLRALRAEGWVSATRDGRTVHYRVRPDAIVHRVLHDIMGASHTETTSAPRTEATSASHTESGSAHPRSPDTSS